ncbi:Cof-type HAD-IIB family hydrolase [Flagellimonas flava]|uniref:Cof subfamily of IIB subfamily of haloacid dehalogenase superfamily/HAD-superfamily hydrolase, subfamily IIB n=1 Tax=Flagellimonas flava TaxID=570519 RepID=A0A1M5PKK6_9FLAO|nr:Cof-type HAD-IIB family hydrolase [Allomuricauda flava]SHH02230.1 hypothetical protein SAMN04488116_3244 [Allomuricauda flava]
MNFKILCSDLDGTLLSSKNDVSDFTVSEMNRIKDRMRVILVSARMPKSMVYLQKRLGIENNPIICYNGALVIENGNEISNTMLSPSLVENLYERCHHYDIKMGLYRGDEWCVEETSERVEKEIFNTKATPVFESTTVTLNRWKTQNMGAHKIMLMGNKASMDKITPLLDAQFQKDMHCYRSNDTLIEIAPKSVSKLSAIQSLLRQGETLGDVIAFGDNYNDIDMLKNVGYGVAVANARPEVKNIVQKVTLDNKSSGVAQFIKDHL